MKLKVRHKYGRIMENLLKHGSLEVNDVGAGLFFSRGELRAVVNVNKVKQGVFRISLGEKAFKPADSTTAFKYFNVQNKRWRDLV